MAVKDKGESQQTSRTLRSAPQPVQLSNGDIQSTRSFASGQKSAQPLWNPYARFGGFSMALNDSHRLCLEALSSHTLHHDPASDDGLSGLCTASKFSQQAVASLNPQQLARLQEFLTQRGRSPLNQHSRELVELDAKLATAVQTFHTQEMALSHLDEKTLARPGGLAGAVLAMVLHLETKDDNFGDIFNDASATIQLLKEKGVLPALTFGMDWHWRGETREQFKNRRWCVFHERPKAIRLLHDDFSWEVLEMVPALFVVTGSACAREGIRRRLPSHITLNVDDLEFDLDFRPDGLRRIILHLPRPTHGFFSDKATKDKMGINLDQGWNFVMWLAGQEYQPNTFRREYNASTTERLYQCSPVTSMWNYIRQERELERLLRLDQYTLPFLRFAENYLRQDSAAIASGGKSLVAAVNKKCLQNLSAAATVRERRRKQERQSKLLQPSNKPAITESIQGSTARVTPSGFGTIRRQSPLAPLKFRTSEEIGQRIDKLQEESFVYLTINTFSLQDSNSELVYERPIDTLLQQSGQSGNCEEWNLQFAYEMQLVGQSFTPELIRNPSRANTTDLRMKLLRGSTWKVKKGRCVISGIQLSFKADEVFIQAELVAEGREHHNYLCSSNISEDPGRRLGLKAKVGTEGDCERWMKIRGDDNARRTNTLVDLLDGRQREWTAEQPRRLLKAWKEHSTWKTPDN